MTEEQKLKIKKWMINDDEYSKYLISKVPTEGESEVETALREKSPKLFLATIFHIEKEVEFQKENAPEKVNF